MDRLETLKVMAVLRGAYPGFYRSVGKAEAEDTVNLWSALFAGDPYPLVEAAVKSYIQSDERGFPPVPGQIAAKLRLLTEPEGLTEGEAWALVSKAIKNGIYGWREEYERLPPLCQRAVGRAEQLRDWALMDSDTVHSVVSSNFQRSYRTARAREEELAKLPAEVRELLAGGAPALEGVRRGALADRTRR